MIFTQGEIEALSLIDTAFALIDLDTYQIEHINNKMCEIINSTPKQAIGKNFYSFVLGLENPEKGFMDTETYEAPTATYHDLNTGSYKYVNTIATFSGRKVIICKLIEISSQDQSTDFNNTMKKCIDIFKSTEPFESLIGLTLKTLCNHYSASECYVFLMDNERRHVQNTYMHLKKEVCDMIEASYCVEVPNLDEFWATFASLEFQTYDNIETELDHDSLEYKFLNARDAKSFSITPIKNGTEVIAFIILTDPVGVDANAYILSTIAVYIQDHLKQKYVYSNSSRSDNIDKLTGCYNRLEYNKKLEMFNDSSKNLQHLGIIYCDINGLRNMNAVHGYAYADEKIVGAAKIMKEAINLPFYRLAGDEFLCFIEDANEIEFNECVEKLKHEVANNPDACFAVGHTWKTGKGISLMQIEDTQSMMYINKQKYYQEHVDNINYTSSAVLKDLLYAVSNNEIRVYLQPKFSLKTDEIIGAEALVRRFNTKENKLVFPDQFIPLYEEQYIIRHVDFEVLRQICEYQQQWVKLGKNLKISVNFSRITLKEDDVVESIVKICDRYGVPHKLIVIEITERVGLLTDTDVEESLVNQFIKHGFTLSLDDFGCAYSNIVTLANIEIDEVKIDKSLIDYIETNEKNKIIVRNIIDMCNEMEHETVAEGVETQEQAEILRSFNCTQVQGYLYSRPIPANEFVEKYVEV